MIIRDAYDRVMLGDAIGRTETDRCRGQRTVECFSACRVQRRRP